jgi:hypothetical protein
MRNEISTRAELRFRLLLTHSNRSVIFEAGDEGEVKLHSQFN